VIVACPYWIQRCTWAHPSKQAMSGKFGLMLLSATVFRLAAYSLFSILSWGPCILRTERQRAVAIQRTCSSGKRSRPMKRILILYATKEGQTEKVASQIAKHLENAGGFVQLVNVEDKQAITNIEFDAFDLLAFGASMHAGGLERELVNYINERREAIELKERSFFLVLLSAATKNSEVRETSLQDARRKMAEQLRTTFEDTEMIAGALMYSEYSLPMKWIMKRIAGKTGGDTDTSRNYEYTDWDQVKKYANRLFGSAGSS